MCFKFHHRLLIQHRVYLFTWFYIQLYFSVDILSSPGHPTPIFPCIRRTEIRNDRCEDSYICVIRDGVSAFRSFCGHNQDISVTTVIPAQVFFIRLITLFIVTRNFSFSPFISRHMDQPCCTGDMTQNNCKEKKT